MMIQRWQTVQVFLSSTFRDMHAERDHLVKVVFPALRERLERYRIELIDIDLRWGVTAEDADNDRVLEICLDQIEACRPFFIGILGERYGWVPTILPEAAKLNYGWIPKMTGRSVTELEILHGVLNQPEMADHAFFYFRDSSFHSQLDEINRSIFLESPSDQEIADLGYERAQEAAIARKHKLEELKDRIRTSIFPVFDPYPVQWEPHRPSPELGTSGRVVDLKEFGEAVERDLLNAIAVEHPQVLAPVPKPAPIGSPEWFEEEADSHLRLVEQKLRVHVGRDLVHRQLLTYIGSKDQRALLLTGGPGSGKSAVLARLCHHIEESVEATTVIPHFVGASPASTDLRLSLKRLAGTLNSVCGFDLELPEEVPELLRTLRAGLSQVPVESKIVIVVDGLDQLEEHDPEQALMWLPESLPQQVRIVIGRASAQHSGLLAGCRRLALTRLSLDERIEIVTTIPSLSAKSLDNEQVMLLLDNPATANPLFLIVALEELRGFGSFEGLNSRICELPRSPDEKGIVELFTQFLQRLETDLPSDMVRETMSALSATRSGMSEAELMEFLDTVDVEERGELLVLLRQLRGHLMRRGPLLCFAHRSLFEAVKCCYFDDPAKGTSVHLRLAEYFSHAPFERRIAEQPWQLASAGAWPGLYSLLSDLDFLADLTTADAMAVNRLWSLLESRSELRMIDAYTDLVSSPDEYSVAELDCVCRLLDDAGYLDQALDLWHHLIGRLKDEGDRTQLAWAVRGFSMALYRRGVYEGAATNHAWEERICNELGDSLGAMRALQGQGRSLQALGDIEGAMACFGRYREAAEENGAQEDVAFAVGNQGLLLVAHGEYDEALRLLKTEETLFRELGRLDGVQRALGNQAVVFLEQQEPEKAEPLLKEKARICREIGDREELAAALGNLGIVAMLRQDLETASIHSKEQEELARALGNKAQLADAIGKQALILKTRGQSQAAFELLREQEGLERALDRPASLAKALLNQALILAVDLQDYAQALARADEVLPLLEQAEPRLLEHARRVRAEINQLYEQNLHQE
ncbi:MAG: DUF4062 domain-containing protein [Thermoanaerobaculales bacterium]|nr:DUF4062 domain-containing protein [Thermoanaerobaculales bacterium]